MSVSSVAIEARFVLLGGRYGANFSIEELCLLSFWIAEQRLFYRYKFEISWNDKQLAWQHGIFSREALAPWLSSQREFTHHSVRGRCLWFDEMPYGRFQSRQDVLSIPSRQLSPSQQPKQYALVYWYYIDGPFTFFFFGNSWCLEQERFFLLFFLLLVLWLNSL